MAHVGCAPQRARPARRCCSVRPTTLPTPTGLTALLALTFVALSTTASARAPGARAPDRLSEPADEPWRAHGEPLERSDTATQLLAPTGRLALHGTLSLHFKPSGPDVTALAMLDVPLGALLAKKTGAAPKARAEPRSEPAPAPGQRRSSAAPEPQAALAPPAPESPPPTTPPPAVEASPYPAFVVSPEDARALVTAAQGEARLQQAERRLSSLATRARASALLPELRLRAARVTDEEERLAPTDYDPTRRLASVSSSLWLEARATFRLDRLVFADEEAGLERLKRELREERARLSATVLAHVAALARAHARANDASLPEAERALAWLSVVEHESALDELTGGASRAVLRAAAPRADASARALGRARDERGLATLDRPTPTAPPLPTTPSRR